MSDLSQGVMLRHMVSTPQTVTSWYSSDPLAKDYQTFENTLI
jgi:hypothetical protein